ncbi:hypothetical protein JHK82_047786 [Glycine max]|uniref:Uncharacterized protein n=1 Tax=Glycine soja TaxID=3848 RepID=A0A0B2Q6N3_GLYSO|nr:hypothetical protein JHK85_048287 [Glycine max]KAG5097932.1 hypothetical protein JHK82_047786 [Glycine max]KAG5102726.1 hypothetical protein JHK84_047695 [Glycine max]KHN15639.1 hypothetical protein glysoja_031428 [Glycine soja]
MMMRLRERGSSEELRGPSSVSPSTTMVLNGVLLGNMADLGGGAIASTNLDGGLELVGPTSLALKRSPTAIVVGVLWEGCYVWLGFQPFLASQWGMASHLRGKVVYTGGDGCNGF